VRHVYRQRGLADAAPPGDRDDRARLPQHLPEDGRLRRPPGEVGDIGRQSPGYHRLEPAGLPRRPAQDRQVYPLHLAARVDAQLVAQPTAPAVVVAQRVGGPADPVQREHRQRGEPLPTRVGDGQSAQLIHDLVVAAEPQLQLVQVLGGGQPRRLQALAQRRLRGRAELAAEDRPAPQDERLPQQPAGLLVATGCVSPGEDPAEPVRVDPFRRDPQEVSTGVGTQPCPGAGEDRPQLGDAALDDRPGPGRRPPAPQQIDQPVTGNAGVGLERQDAEDQPLLAPCQMERLPPRTKPRPVRGSGPPARSPL
jgi:hypothetical protein